MDDIKRRKIQKWLGGLSIPNLMTYVVAGMAVVFVVQTLLPGYNLYGLLALDRAALMRGQVWRLVTFIFMPPSTSIIWIVFSLYFYWMIGSSLEGTWGSARFTLFYLVGMLGGILSALITGGASNVYLNLSLFLAFAVLNPDYQVMVFLVLPVKVKYLALLDAALYLYLFILGPWSVRVAILFALANLFLFMGGDLINRIRQESRYFKTRRNFRRAMRGR